jgi:DNA (cytosine-5)-methyltransferase 1
LNLSSDILYKEKLLEQLNAIELTYNELSTEENPEFYLSLLKKVTMALNILAKESTLLKEELSKSLDISDIIYFTMELRKNLKNHPLLFNDLDLLSKDKEFRTLRREIKALTKKISQLHETILTLEELDKIHGMKNYKDKKDYVDTLYKKDNFVKKSYLNNYQLDTSHFHQNIAFLDAREYKNKVDLYVGGSPCQSFSIVGKRGGFEDTRGTLFYEYVRVLKEIEPRFFIYENVKGVLSHDKGKTWETMQNTFKDTGYMFKSFILNSKDFGIPQHRERLFVIGFKEEKDYKKFEDPEKSQLKITMKDFLEDYVDDKYYLPKKGIKFVTDEKNIKKRYTQVNGEIALCQKANQQFNWHGDFIESYTEEEKIKMGKIDSKYFLSKNVKKYILDDVFFMNNKPSEELIDLDIARPLTASMHKMHRAGVDNYVSYGKVLPVKDREIRKLTPRECFRLMGFCDTFELTVSDTQLYKQAGNSIVVDVLMAIVKQIVKIH